MKSIFIDCNDQLAPIWQNVLRAGDPPIDVNMTPFKRDELPLVLAGYDIAIDDHSYMPTDLVERCKQLKHIVFLGTGPASYMNVGELNDRGIKVHIIKGYGDTAVAEHSIALMVAAARDVARMDREVRSGVWTPQEGVQLFGKTLGVIGLGGIGAEVARMGKGLGMEVIAYNRTPRPQAGVPQVDIDTLLAKSDVVSMNLTLGDETRGFLSRRAHRTHEAGRDPDQHRARRAGRRGGAHCRAQERPHSPRRARRVPRRAAQAGSAARQIGKRHADVARRLPHHGSVDDAAAALDRYCEDDRRLT